MDPAIDAHFGADSPVSAAAPAVDDIDALADAMQVGDAEMSTAD